jgi:hypothetical protein
MPDRDRLTLLGSPVITEGTISSPWVGMDLGTVDSYTVVQITLGGETLTLSLEEARRRFPWAFPEEKG